MRIENLRKYLPLLVVLLGASTASAQPAGLAGELGQRGTWFLSADRVVPVFAYTRDTQTDNNASFSTSTSSISLLSYGVPSNIAYTIPRIAVDYAIAPHLTLGGAFAAFFDLSSSSTTKFGGMSMTADNPKVSGFLITPRIGYLVPIGPRLAIWPRGGFSYYSESVSNPPNMMGNSTTDGFHQLALDLEGNLVIAAAPHFLVMIGPVIDVPLSGSTSVTNGNTTTSVDYSQFHFGITGGIGGYF
jgi:hypothetical protein